MNNIMAIVKKNNVFFILLSIMILGTWLRFKGLIFNDHWLDELYSADFSNPARSFNSMLKITLEDVHPPVYQILLWVWYKLFGFTEYTGRSLSAIIGIAGIYVIYLLGKELFNKYVGLYASLLVSINIFLINYSQETRSYSLFFLLVMLSYMYLSKVLHNPSKKNILLYWVFTIIMFYTHYFSFFLVAIQAVVFLVYTVQFAEDKKKLYIISFWTAVLFIVSILPLVPYILAHIHGEGLGSLNVPSPFFFVSYLISYFGKNIFIIFLGGALSLIYLIRGKTLTTKEKFSLILLLIWIILGYLLPYLKSIFSSPLLSPRYTIVMIPAILLIASYGFWRVKGWGYLMISIIFLYSLKVLFINYYGVETKDQYSEVLKTVVKYNQVPIYEKIPYNGHHGNITNHYQTYADMLNLNMNILNDIILTRDIKDGTLPGCFWVLNAHFSPGLIESPNYKIQNSKISKNTSIKIVKQIQYKGAEGYLLSYKINPKECLKQVGISN